MNRLTRKIKDCFCIDLRTNKPMEYEQVENSNACVDKLGQLEDIEEELGIDLITLFKVSENGFYMINEGQIKFVKQGYQFNLRGRYIHLNSGYKELDFKLEDKPFSDILLFKDYGTTWSLDIKDLLKENLEND